MSTSMPLIGVVSHTVQALTGHAPQAFSDYFREHPESYQHVTAGRFGSRIA